MHAASTWAEPAAPGTSVGEAELLEQARALAAQAAQQGADEAEACLARSTTLSVSFEKGDLKLARVAEGASAGLRVFRGQRLGFAATNQLTPQSLEASARTALALAAAAPPDAANRLPRAREIARLPPLVEPGLAELSVEAVVELGARLVRAARAVDPRLSIDSASCELVRSTHALAATTGAAVSESDAALSFSILGMAIDGSDVAGFHYGGRLVRVLAQAQAQADALALEFAQVALANLGAGAAHSYRGRVLLSPEAFHALLIAPLLSAASAIAVQRGRSALAGRRGQSVASELLTLTDDPTDPTLAGATSYDREGQPATRLTLIEQGVLREHLYNGYAAAVEGRDSTGHAVGGPRSVPGLSAHGPCVAAGTGGTLAEMLARLERGLYVQRFSGTVDAASGDFSGVAKSARWVEGGRVVRPVKETLLAGNAFVLLKDLLALSSEIKDLSGHARTPWALVDGVGVTAG